MSDLKQKTPTKASYNLKSGFYFTYFTKNRLAALLFTELPKEPYNTTAFQK